LIYIGLIDNLTHPKNKGRLTQESAFNEYLA